MPGLLILLGVGQCLVGASGGGSLSQPVSLGSREVRFSSARRRLSSSRRPFATCRPA